MSRMKDYICSSLVYNNNLSRLLCLSRLQNQQGQLLLLAIMSGDHLLVSYISHVLHAEEILSTSLKLNQHILKCLNIKHMIQMHWRIKSSSREMKEEVIKFKIINTFY